jgi:thioredoxin
MQTKGQRIPGISGIVFTIIFLSMTAVKAQNAFAPLLPDLEFAEKIDAYPDAPIIDVRTPEEFAKGHIPNANNFDWHASGFHEQIATLDKSKPVFTYCLAGSRSADATKKMLAAGFVQVFELKGGILKWRAAGLPEEYETTIRPDGMTRMQFDNLLVSDKFILVDFFAEWCVPCKKMKPSLDRIARDMADEVTVVRINADDNPTLCNDLKVNALPVLQLYKDQTLIWTHTGYLSMQEIMTALASF